MKRSFICAACYFNRNLRYGNSTSRFLQFLVIRTRTYLKKYIYSNIDFINEIGEVEIKLKYAGKMRLVTSDYVDRWLFTGADFEPDTVKLIQKYLSKDDNFLDIGANIGYFSLIASQIVGKRGTVYSFEPTPETISRLHKNIRLNNLRNIQVIENAVSNQKGSVTFKIPSDKIRNSGRSSMRDIEENFFEISVDTISIDLMMDSLKKIALIKMDIEGAEGLALDGMKNLIKRDRPVIIMELSDGYLKQMGYSAEKVLGFLRNQKYKVCEASNRGKEISMEDISGKFQCDILCIPETYRFDNLKKVV
jgi:FkbM family methyltransferase